MKSRTIGCMLAIIALLLSVGVLLTLPLHAQNFYGSIVGTVTDASGAVVPGATVTITDVATDEKRTAQSSDTGDFSFVSLVPATYTVEAQKTTFKRVERKNVVVQVGATVRVNVAMEVGTATETVEVTTETPLLQTDSATQSSVIEGQTVDQMPLNGRNTMSLVALAPGVVPMTSAAGGQALGNGGGGHTINSNWNAYSIGGGLTGQSAMYLDGMPMNLLGGGGAIAFVPTQDAIQEFSVSTNASTSEFGRYSGGVINMTTKSGTNKWHGTAYEYFRNNILNANDWFNKRAQAIQGVPNKPGQWNVNQYGAEVSGPIKKNKLFGMFSWENFTARLSSLQNRQVPTANMLKGILDYGDAASATAAYNSIVNNNLKAGACHPTQPSSTQVQLNGGVMTATSGCFDPTALAIMTEWPAPTPGYTNSVHNFDQLSGFGADTHNYIGRGDYIVSQKQRLFARYVRSNLADMPQQWAPGGKMPGGGTWVIGGGTTHNRVHAGVLGDTYAFNPSTILDLRLSINRVYSDQVPPTVGNTALVSVLGGNWATLAAKETVFNIPVTYFGNVGGGNDVPCNPGVTVCAPVSFTNASRYSWQINDNTGLVFSLTKIFGAHSLKVGGETRYMDRAVLAMSTAPNTAGGSLNFPNTYWTQSYWGNFLTGLANTATMPKVREVGSYNWYQGYYINDTWQATRKLTVNAGLRWELPGNVKEKHDNSITLQPGIFDTTDYPGYSIPGTVALVNSSVYPDRGSEPARHNLFAPNLGFAYRLTNNDVVRAGYGYSVAAIDIASGIFPETFSMNSNVTTWNYDQQHVQYPLSDPFPTSVYPTLNAPLTRAQVTRSIFFKSNVTAPVATNVVPTTQQWNFTVSHQFAGNMSIEIGYAGAIARGLPMGYNFNELPSIYWNDQSMSVKTSTSAATTVTASQLALCAAVNGTTTYGQCARPYSAYQNFNDAFGATGWMNYQSLPVRLQKRFKSGGLITASYTWAKELSNYTGSLGATGAGVVSPSVQDWYNLRAEKSLDGTSIPRRLVVSYVLNLPFGQGQMFLGNLTNGIANAIVSGWTVNGITSFQDGFPLSFNVSYPSGNASIPGSFGATIRPNYTTGCNKLATGSWKSHVVAGTPVVNTACWSVPPVSYKVNGTGTGYATTVGNEPRVDPKVKAPGIINSDLTLQKKVKVAEGMNVEFRWELFNAFNRYQFGSPGGTVGSGTFGVITGAANNSAPRLQQLSLRMNF